MRFDPAPTTMARVSREGGFVRALGATVVIALSACSATPPTTGGTTDLSDTDGGEGDDLGATGVAESADETGDGGESVADHRTYYIGESKKFDGGGECEGSRLNAVTWRLRRRLDRAGWTGLRLVDDNTWPEDFWEATTRPNGMDDGFGDAHRLTVYAGHGGPGELQWGRPSDHGECRVVLPDDARLGRLAGDTAAAVMLVTSCTLLMPKQVLWSNFQKNAARQIFGYHNSPHVASRELRDVFKRTQDGQSTKDAWLDEMEDNIVLGKNSPVVLTMGVDGPEAMQVHGATNLATGEGFIHNAGEPADAFFFEWLDNGCTRACGGCSGVAPRSAPMPALIVGSEVPVIELQRPARSAEELIDRASVLVSLLLARPMSTAQRIELDRWAQRIARDGDLAVNVLPGTPRVQLAYDPSADELVVDNLDARRAARPELWEASNPGREHIELELAQEVRHRVLDELDTLELDLIGVPRGSTFSHGTRKAGAIVSGQSWGSIPFETIFSTFGEFAGYPVFGARLEIGITRHGELSRLGVSAMQVAEVGTAEVRRTVDQARYRLEQDIAASNPQMLELEVVDTRVGFVSPGGPTRAALGTPELAVDYVVLHRADRGEPMVSRRYPARVSLVTDSPPRPRPEPDDPIDDPGDLRP